MTKTAKTISTNVLHLAEDADREEVAQYLDSVLSEEYLLHAKTRDCDMHIADPELTGVHEILSGQCREIDDIVKELAERSRALGGRSLSTIKEFLEKAQLKESKRRHSDARIMLGNLLSDQESLVRALQAEQLVRSQQRNNESTSLLLMKLIARHEKMAWMLQRFLDFKRA